MLSAQQLGSLLWCGIDPWPRNFHMQQAQPKKERKKERKKEEKERKKRKKERRERKKEKEKES